MSLTEWFQKAKAESEGIPKEVLDMQGKYTDHVDTAYGIRQHIAPLHGTELEAFDYVMQLMAKAHPEAEESQRDLIEYAFSEGWFYEGDHGELRVSQEAP